MKGAVFFLGSIALIAAAIFIGYPRLPDRWDPWADLELNETPGLLTRYKLARLSADPDSCRRILATSPFDFAALEDRETGPGCGFYNAVRIGKTSAEVGKSFTLTCRSAVSLALWEQHALQPAAQRYFGQPVARIEHFGSYACRNVYGRSNAVRSQHAIAEAFDIAGFVLADGTRIRVLSDWEGDADRAAFLRDVRTSACDYFDAVLSPDYNAAHRDHFHFDRGRWRTCR